MGWFASNEGAKVLYSEEYKVSAGDFAAAGEVSARIKQKLKKLGIPQDIVRRISIASYESELNMIIHSHGGTMTLLIEPNAVTVKCDDIGPGIPDIEQAMQEGFSTAPESIRMMGFGAGMGLSNINKNSDQLQIQSDPGGTHICMRFTLAA